MPPDPSSGSGTIGSGNTNSETVGVSGRAVRGEMITFVCRGMINSRLSLSTALRLASGSFSASRQLLSGQTNQLTTIATNDLGLSSAGSPALSVIVDTVAPSTSTVVLTSPGSGASGIGRVTNAYPILGVTSLSAFGRHRFGNAMRGV